MQRVWGNTQGILMSEEFTIPWYVLVAVGIPMLGLALGLGRLKQKVDTLETSDTTSSDTHDKLFSKVGKIERNLYHLMGKLDVEPID